MRVFCLFSLIVAIIQPPFGYLVLAGLPELAPGPGLSSCSVEYSGEILFGNVSTMASITALRFSGMVNSVRLYKTVLPLVFPSVKR